jgi:hypothetical protein
MAVLRVAIAAAVLSGCYSPSLRDCAVACESTSDCAPSQVCGADHWCASPELAGKCMQPEVSVDGSPAVVPDARADAPLDAPGPVIMTVMIAGHGTVTIPGVGQCAETSPGHMCTFAVMFNANLMLTAVGTGDDEFDKWQSAACLGQGATCSLTVTAPVTVAVKFMH